ncbi:MAG: CpaF/VirB11 family protein [Micrococcales bacterium]|nr:CpaF/VirB11 family protein [Micrococcales bacterium]
MTAVPTHVALNVLPFVHQPILTGPLETEPVPAQAGSAYTPGTDATFWASVRELRAKVSDRVRDELGSRALDTATREQLGRHHIQQVVDEHAQELVDRRKPPLGATVEAHLVQVLFDAMFRLGRLQPLVDLPGATDIEIYGHDRVLVLFADGHREWHRPVADSDEDLVAYLQLLAAREPDNEQAFTPVHRHLEMALPGRGRLAAAAFGVTPRPRVTIRLQHLQSVDLAMLRAQDEIDTILEGFLTAAVRARRSIVVSGQGQGSGKTTFLRALCSAIDPGESVATVEDDYELFLHEEPDRHHRVFAQQTFHGAGEVDVRGGRAGQLTAGELLRRALRHTIDRIIVGEVRDSDALLAMFEAMQAGNGSLSTVHADSANDVVERLVGLAVRDSSVSETYAYRQVAETIDLIVFLGVQLNPDGSKTRFVREIVEPSRGESGTGVALTDVFVPNRAGRAVPHIAPSFISSLVAAGFDQSCLNTGGTWRTW